MQQVSTNAVHLAKTLTKGQIHVAARKRTIPGHMKHHTFRHSFATHVLEGGYDIRKLRELVTHKEAVRDSPFYRDRIIIAGRQDE